MPTLDELGWLAGIIDGEGTVGLYRGNKNSNTRFIPTLYITNTNQAIVVKMQTILDELVEDGSVRCMPVKQRASHHKPAWRIAVTTRLGLFKVLDAVLPYLSGKAPQAVLVKRWCERRLLKGIGKHLNSEDFALTAQFDTMRPKFNKGIN
jgi:hypothetical protein